VTLTREFWPTTNSSAPSSGPFIELVPPRIVIIMIGPKMVLEDVPLNDQLVKGVENAGDAQDDRGDD